MPTKYIHLVVPEDKINIIPGSILDGVNTFTISFDKPGLRASKRSAKDYIKSEIRNAKIKIAKRFIKEFCNDHNENTRWLRSVAFDMDHLLEKILVLFEDEVNNGKEKKEKKEKE